MHAYTQTVTTSLPCCMSGLYYTWLVFPICLPFPSSLKRLDIYTLFLSPASPSLGAPLLQCGFYICFGSDFFLETTGSAQARLVIPTVSMGSQCSRPASEFLATLWPQRRSLSTPFPFHYATVKERAFKGL